MTIDGAIRDIHSLTDGTAAIHKVTNNNIPALDTSQMQSQGELKQGHLLGSGFN